MSPAASPRVIVTRPAAQAVPFVDRLRQRGIDAVALPLLDILPIADPAPLDVAWARLGEAALVMFVSANAVEHFFARCPPGQAWPAGTLAGSTGPGTSRALRAQGVPEVQIAEPPPGGPYDTEALWQRLRDRPWAGRQAWIVRGESGRDWLSEQLQLAGAQVRHLAAYRRVGPAWDDAAMALVRQALDRPEGHLWHFSSSEAIAHLVQGTPAARWARSQALATHPRIAEAARRAGFGTVEPVGVDADDVADRVTRSPRR